MKTRVIIIGAGVGALSLAIYLGQRGWEVDIFEKQSHPGGRCGRIERDGHHFDLGATLMLMPELFRSIYMDWDQNVDDHLQLAPLKPIYELFFENRHHLAFTTELPALRDQFERIEKGSFESFLRYVDLGWRQYQGLMGRFLGRNYVHPWQYFNPVNAYYFMKYKAYHNHYRYTRRYFKSPELQAAVTFQNIYVGQSPFDASAAYMLLPALEVVQGGWYPKGGMACITRSLVKIAETAGVRIHYNSEVAQILVRDGQATAIRLSDGTETSANLFVANADLPYVYQSMLPKSREMERLQHMRYTCSAVVLHWGMTKAFPQLGHHNIFLAENYRAGFEGIFKHHGMGKPPHFYLNHPTHTDQDAAPAGRDSLSLIVPVGHLRDDISQNKQEIIREAREAVFQTLAKHGITDIEKSILFEISYAPEDWHRQMHLSHGAIFGSLDHSLTQVGYLRPSNRHAHYRNLYFVGGSTRPGSGVPLALLSGRLTAERILVDRGESHPFSKKINY